METNENTRLTDKIIEALRASALEMEKFQVKATLGMAEAKDSFEEIKKKLNLLIHDSKFKIKTGKEKMDEIQAKLENLCVQLNFGKAETIDAFNEQKKQLLSAIHELEVKITTNEHLKKTYALFLIQMEIFKVELEILEKKFNKKGDTSESTFKRSKKSFLEFVDRLKSKYGKKKETKWEHFQ